MSYIDENLMTGERVVYRARLHKIVYGWAAFFAFFDLIILLAGAWVGAILLLLIAASLGLVAYIRIRTSEFGVTNKRVLIKVGVLSRRSLELLLPKVEGIGVAQGITARIFDYGTIIVTGTGGTKEPFKTIAKPLVFRKNVQEQISAPQTAEPVAVLASR